MSKDQFTFKCTTCDATLTMDESNPPDDDADFSCSGCGRVIGKWSVVRQALIDASKAKVDAMFKDAFGVKPTWRKG